MEPRASSEQSNAVEHMCRKDADPFDAIAEYEENGGSRDAGAFEEMARYEWDSETEFPAMYGDSNDEKGSVTNGQEPLFTSEKDHESDGHSRSQEASGPSILAEVPDEPRVHDADYVE
eukprot:3267944-Pyramimonas_sp.AAC.1